MRVIPVLDLKDGVVVRGVAGKRETYAPIRSELAPSPVAGDVARRLVERFGFAEAYVADLDAIAGAEPNWAALRETAAAGLTSLCVDAGVDGQRRAAELARWGDEAPLAGVVVALESLADSAAMKAAFEAIGPSRAVFSLDLHAGAPLTKNDRWRDTKPLEIARAAIEIGFRRLIVLDLANVGVDSGVSTLALCRQLRAESPSLEIIAGGGVRGLGDLQDLSAAGCNAALVASALHDGRLSQAEIESLARSVES